MQVVTLKAPPEDVKRWKEAAEAQGLSFSAWARKRLDMPIVPAGDVVKVLPIPLPKADKVRDKAGEVVPIKLAPRVKPKDCTNRLPRGSFCKQCGSIHQK